jgi:glycosyltransferase involved in cell wall biosynthesis
MFTFNRYELTRLCVLWFLKRRPENCEFIVFDDGSDDRALLGFLKKQQRAGNLSVVHGEQHEPVESKVDRDRRLGAQRRKAVERFMESGNDYLFLMDSDVIFAEGSIEEAIRDLEMLQKREALKAGSITMHALITMHAQSRVQDAIYSRVNISGEAHWLLPRSSIERAGNHFRPTNKGFADEQLHAMWRAGLVHYERSWPPYRVQHLGFGGAAASMIYADHNGKPFWTTGPYQCNHRHGQGRLLCVPGFDVMYFSECLNACSSDEAGAKAYLKHKGV